jgi:cysteinyl-tRNA synthetase
MEEAQKAYQHIKISKERLENFLKHENQELPLSRPNSKIKNYKQNFIEVMDDDFNMPKGLAVLFDLVSQINGELAGEAKEKNKNLAYYRQTLNQITSVFGFDFSKKKLEGITKGKVEELIAERNLYRNQKQFDKSDQIRSRLLEKGVILEDTKEGTIWRRK